MPETPPEPVLGGAELEVPDALTRPKLDVNTASHTPEQPRAAVVKENIVALAPAPADLASDAAIALLPSIDQVSPSRPATSTRVSDNVMRLKHGNSRSSMGSAASKPSQRPRRSSDHSYTRVITPPLPASKRACVAVYGAETDSTNIFPDVVKHTLALRGDEHSMAAVHVFNFRDTHASQQAVSDVILFDVVTETLKAKSTCVLSIYTETGSSHAQLAQLFATQLLSTVISEQDPLNNYLFRASALISADGHVYDVSAGTNIASGQGTITSSEVVITTVKALESFFGTLISATAQYMRSLDEVSITFHLDIGKSDLHSRCQYFQGRVTFLSVFERGNVPDRLNLLSTKLVSSQSGSAPDGQSYLTTAVLADSYNTEYFLCAYLPRTYANADIVESWSALHAFLRYHTIHRFAVAPWPPM